MENLSEKIQNKITIQIYNIRDQISHKTFDKIDDRINYQISTKTDGRIYIRIRNLLG